jgi:transcriptional regulator EpsA
MDSLNAHHSEAIARVIESSVLVRRRYQFFVWSQSKLGVLLPHQIAVCGAYQRASKELLFEAFNSITVPPPLLKLLTDARSTLMQQIVGAWMERHGRALVIPVNELSGLLSVVEREALRQLGIEELLVHGVSRPQRPAELESLFIFTSPNTRSTLAQQAYLEMLLPHLHATYLRALSTESDMAGPSAKVPPSGAPARRGPITDRECQILGLVREGKSNQQIGELLGISPLTVKNHVQKILRKLGAVNRAQAVARAMNMELLERAHGANAVISED